MTSQTVADLVTAALHSVGVRRIYGVVGDSLNGITESLRKRGDIEWIHTRHEETAAFAAGAEAHLTGQLAVCAGSCGPGKSASDQRAVRLPALARPGAGDRCAYPQRRDRPELLPGDPSRSLFRECSHYCELVTNPEQLPGVLETAMRAAIGRRGVAVVVIPGDIALRKVSGVLAAPGAIALRPPVVVPGEQDLAELAALLNASTRTTIVLRPRLRRRP